MNYIKEDYSLFGYGNMSIVNSSWHFRGNWCLLLRGSYWTALNTEEASSSTKFVITNQHGVTLIFTLHTFHRSIAQPAWLRIWIMSKQCTNAQQ